MLAQYLAQGRMQQVRGGVIKAGTLAHGAIHFGLQSVAFTDAALQHFYVVQVLIRALGGIRHFQAHAVGTQITGVTHLAAGFTVERGAVHYHHAGFIGCQRVHFVAVTQDGGHHPRAAEAVIAGEFGLAFQC